MSYCLILILVVLVIWNVQIYLESPEEGVVSVVDGGRYVVKSSYPDSVGASDLLARLNAANTRLIGHLETKYAGTSYGPGVKFLASNYNGDVLQENIPRSTTNTSFVVNKGDVIKLCLRDPTKGGAFHDFDTLMFVNLHEVSHLLDRQYGHSESFWTGFKFILTEAKLLGIYNPVNYDKTPVNYCGMVIRGNPYYG